MRRQANNSPWTGSAVMPMASLCLLGVGLCWNAVAQETIYRCGQEYTNAPKDMALCQPLAEQNIVVIPETVWGMPPRLRARAMDAPRQSQRARWRPCKANGMLRRAPFWRRS